MKDIVVLSACPPKKLNLPVPYISKVYFFKMNISVKNAEKNINILRRSTCIKF